MSTLNIDPGTRPPLNPDLYELPQDPDALAFFKTQTGIIDDEELKNHIMQVQQKAYNVHAYPCIWTFSFLWCVHDNWIVNEGVRSLSASPAMIGSRYRVFPPIRRRYPC